MDAPAARGRGARPDDGGILHRGGVDRGGSDGGGTGVGCRRDHRVQQHRQCHHRHLERAVGSSATGGASAARRWSSWPWCCRCCWSSSSGGSSVTAQDTGETVVVQAEGDYPLIIPWVTGRSIPIEAAAEVHKEGFRSGP